MLSRDVTEETAGMIPIPSAGALPPGTDGRALDPLVQRYRAFFALLDWRHVPERAARRAWPGSPPQPRAAYVKALVVKLVEQHTYITHLRTFLVEHPLLVLELGFRPVLDASHPYGFDVARTVPSARWLRHQQQHLDHLMLTALLADTVQTLRAAVPTVGDTVAVDVKHIYAWVRENNPKEHLPERHDPTRLPRGDPECRLGVKRSTNQAGTTRKEYLWGYGTGIVSATTPLSGDVVLAEWTQPFNQPDITYFHRLDADTLTTLGRRPTHLAADAAFDAWHVYQPYALHGGIAAIPLNERGPRPARDADGHPRCERGWSMTPTSVFTHEDGYRAQRYRCPLLRPTPTGASCDHVLFAAGSGCRKVVNLEPGGQLRLSLDRQAESYRTIYRQRTAAERINSQATALGIERPKVRRLAAVTRLNTLTYIIINLRAIQRLRTRQAAHPPPVLC